MDDFSLEITGKDADAVVAAQADIPADIRINVTFLGNEDLETRVTAAKAVRDAGFIPVPHLAARRITSTDEFRQVLSTLQDLGLSERLFLIAGDPATPHGPYEDALALINTNELSDYGVHEVGISGYPEGHPDVSNAVLDSAFVDKFNALKEQSLEPVVITQFAFDAAAVTSWVRQVRTHGYNGQIRIGTPGPAGIKRLLSYARRFGVASSAGIVKKYGFSLTNLLGTAGPDKFILDMQHELDQDPTLGNLAVHFYTFGGLQATAQWVQEFKQKSR